MYLWFPQERVILSFVIPLVVVQSFSTVKLFETPMDCSMQGTLSFTIFWSLLKLISIESVIPSNHLILCHPLFLLPSIFPSSRVFLQWANSSHQVAEVLGLQLQHQSFQWIFRVDFLQYWLLSILDIKEILKSLPSTTVQRHKFFGTQTFLLSSSHICTWLLEKP